MTVAITTAGYDGTVDETQLAEMFYRYSVLGPEDFKATTQAGDRIVAIADGVALGPATRDVATALPNIQFTAAAAGTTRWDLVALRRDWQPPGGTSAIVIIQGPATKGYPAEGTAANQWNRRPGIMDDQPLYLQEVIGTSLGQRIDLRCWAAHNGLVAASADAKTYLERLGAELVIGSTRWQYRLGDNNVPGWVSDEPGVYAPLGIAGFSTTGQITVEPAGSLKKVTVDVNVQRTGAGMTITNPWVLLGAIIPTAARGSASVKWVPVALTGGSNNNHATASLGPSDGVLSVRSTDASFTWTTNALFTLNLSYYI